MNNIKIFQIYYSESTKAMLDVGFIPLNNTLGRIDWLEYWPIRNYFLNNPINDDELVGFFSPRFYEKTGLLSANVKDIINNKSGFDIFIFNPYFHLAAWHNNVFSQALNSHPGINAIIVDIFKLLNINLSVDSLLMSSYDTIFCNYFVANKRFWKKWLMVCEFIFQLSELKNTDVSYLLNSKTTYIRNDMPMQIFIIERIASLLLCIDNTFKIHPFYCQLNIGYAANKIIPILDELYKLDSLKIAYRFTSNSIFYDNFLNEKNRLVNDYNLNI
jgi:hypothetical protein